MKNFLICMLCAVTLPAIAQEPRQAVMVDGPLRLSGPEIGSGYNFALGPGDSFLIDLECDYSWAGGPAASTSIYTGANAISILGASASQPIWLFGDVNVGLPNGFGGGSLSVRDAITANGSPVARWRGAGVEDPTDALTPGDLFYRTDTSKLRVYTGDSWVNAN